MNDLEISANKNKVKKVMETVKIVVGMVMHRVMFFVIQKFVI